MKKIGLLVGFLFFLNDGFAKTPIVAPQPTSCITGSLSSTGTKSWQTISLKLTNNCNQSVDFQNATITFSNNSNLNTSFWGNFSPLSYPVNTLQITSQPQSNGTYLSSLSLQFPTYPGANSKLPKGSFFTIIYGAPTADYIANSVLVYLNSPVSTGNINLINATAKPANVSQNYALVNLTLNGQTISTVQVPWSGQQLISGLSAGTYTVSPTAVTDSNGVVYQGVANPTNLTVSADTTVSSTLTYTAMPTTGNINITLPALPSQLSGYTILPTVTLTRMDNQSAINAQVHWSTTNVISQLANGVSYSFSTPAIAYNGYNCTPVFTPTSATAAVSAPTVQLTYNCVQVALDSVPITITGAPSSLSSINVTFTPSGNGSAVNETILLSNGTGTSNVNLTDGVVYTVSATAVNGYTISYSPQPLTASSTATETITYTQSTTTGGRIIGYLPGWVTPPSATALANAGYTHILVAFGVFSTTSPGQITSAFDTVSASYIQSLHNAGIKVLLSLGGASSSIPNTTVNFHQVLAAASSPAAFQQTFITSLENLVSQYHFDGFDIDIESGLNAGGTFTNPTGDIAVLANIINTLHTNHPDLLLTLAPQTANVAATSGFDATWGNYASLVMQTHQSLEWVGIQMYNAGCTFGIDLICYDPNNTATPNASVAMATDLLENWPAVTSSGQQTGFQPYISYLTPSQVVLGYPAPNASGQSDGSPAAVISTIKRAIQCLRTGVASSSSCDTYVPPRAYPGFGGVFDWEVIHDQNNNYHFATSLVNCVINNNCN
ncbi:glycosyl hydrolase family 18 protein [Fluoribacter gormanii]|uniref:chitinase n=1 Tax=Fluoribacter gormanii TaxID=464 RepID=A0A377GLJ4_9GAMM|nr:glycosyl hydrolase family 18 protein [Fluoribacter gormanii]KTD01787.1 chitinase [Fluoribacter gormanii]SIR20741.1 chitinase family 18 [Fluoribacter gormanii]STO25443.1 Chitinase D precursor [Fluoribacter gormanii]